MKSSSIKFICCAFVALFVVSYTFGQSKLLEVKDTQGGSQFKIEEMHHYSGNVYGISSGSLVKIQDSTLTPIVDSSTFLPYNFMHLFSSDNILVGTGGDSLCAFFNSNNPSTCINRNQLGYFGAPLILNNKVFVAQEVLSGVRIWEITAAGVDSFIIADAFTSSGYSMGLIEFEGNLGFVTRTNQDKIAVYNIPRIGKAIKFFEAVVSSSINFQYPRDLNYLKGVMLRDSVLTIVAGEGDVNLLECRLGTDTINFSQRIADSRYSKNYTTTDSGLFFILNPNEIKFCSSEISQAQNVRDISFIGGVPRDPNIVDARGNLVYFTGKNGVNGAQNLYTVSGPINEISVIGPLYPNSSQSTSILLAIEQNESNGDLGFCSNGGNGINEYYFHYYNSSKDSMATWAVVDTVRVSGYRIEDGRIINGDYLYFGGQSPPLNRDKLFAYLLDNKPNAAEFIENSQLKLFPNPTSKAIRITRPSGFVVDNYQVIDLKGRRVLIGDTTNSDLVNVERLPIGIYFLKILSGDETFVLKFIKD